MADTIIKANEQRKLIHSKERTREFWTIGEIDQRRDGDNQLLYPTSLREPFFSYFTIEEAEAKWEELNKPQPAVKTTTPAERLAKSLTNK
jgi:hypothetical protein